MKDCSFNGYYFILMKMIFGLWNWCKLWWYTLRTIWGHTFIKLNIWWNIINVVSHYNNMQNLCLCVCLFLCPQSPRKTYEVEQPDLAQRWILGLWIVFLYQILWCCHIKMIHFYLFIYFFYFCTSNTLLNTSLNFHLITITGSKGELCMICYDAISLPGNPLG